MNKTRTAGLFYLLTFITGITSMVVRGKAGLVVGLVAGGSYVVVTVLLYQLFTPVNKPISLIAAVVSFLGIAAGAAQLTRVNPLVFFGVYCLLIGYLLLKSTFAPRFLGVLMACAGAGWLTFLSPSLATQLFPYSVVP